MLGTVTFKSKHVGSLIQWCGLSIYEYSSDTDSYNKVTELNVVN